MISAGGFSAHQMAFRSTPVDLFGREGNDEDMLFTQDTPLSGQVAQQRKPRMRSQDAAPKDVANSSQLARN